MTNEAVDDIWADWQKSINMSPKELEDWLDGDESRRVGDKSGGEAVHKPSALTEPARSRPHPDARPSSVGRASWAGRPFVRRSSFISASYRWRRPPASVVRACSSTDRKTA